MDAARARAATTATKSGVETHYLEGLECRCAFHQRRGESSSGTRAEQTNTRERPPREQRIAGLAGQLDRIVDDIGVLNDELETKESEFGALALIVRAMPMPKKRKRAVESPTSYEDVFERAKFPAYVTPAQKEFILVAISTALGREILVWIVFRRAQLMTTHAFFILIPSPPSLGNTYGLFPLLVFRVKKN